MQNVKNKAVISYKLIKGGAKTADFHNFLKSIEFPTKGKKCVLLDNARIHHATDSCHKVKLSTIAELAIENRIFTWLFSSIESNREIFSVIKQFYRKRRPRTEEELRKVIEEVISELQSMI